MAPEVRWQASSAAGSSGSDTLAPDRESVESLLRKLIKRIEESERRYEEALDELHARLGQVSYSASVNEALGTPEETETLERLRRQLSDLARRLEQPQPKKVPDRLPRLDKALDEVRAVSAGLALAEPDWFASLSASLAAAEGRAEPEPAPALLPASEPSYASQSFAPSIDEDADFDRRLIDMAQRLERSIGEALPSSAIENLNARIEEISARFEAALAQEQKLETLHHIERQVADMGFQLGRVEQQAARIGAVEGQLQRLIERIEATPAQIERTATKAAQETARLVSEIGIGKPSAAERLDALRRDIVAMNERNLATDDRLVDTLTAMHESLKGLMQRERERAAATASREVPPRIEPAASEVGAGDFAQSRQPVAAAQIQAAEPPRQRTTFIRDIPFESTEDLVAAARRAAQAAAARAEKRHALPQRKVRATAETKPSEEPGRHKVSLLMVAAAILLMISAALLLTRLKLKPDFDAPPPAAEQSMPAPAAEAPPSPDTPLQTDVIPSPEESMPSGAAAPEVLPESEAPDAAPTAPHAITPSPSPHGTGARSPVHLGDGADEALVQPVSLSPAGGQSLPPQRDGRRAQISRPKPESGCRCRQQTFV
jgi:localization factor PodJL